MFSYRKADNDEEVAEGGDDDTDSHGHSCRSQQKRRRERCEKSRNEKTSCENVLAGNSAQQVHFYRKKESFNRRPSPVLLFFKTCG
jgi:hypothetical protein